MALVSFLNEVAHKVIAVRGNCDSEVDQMLLHFPITAPWQQVLLEKQRLLDVYKRQGNIRCIFPAVSNSVFPSQGRWQWNRKFYYLMNLPLRSILNW